MKVKTVSDRGAVLTIMALSCLRPGMGRSPNQHWRPNSCWSWIWSGLSRLPTITNQYWTTMRHRITTPRIEGTLSFQGMPHIHCTLHITYGYATVFVWICGTGPNVRATKSRLRPTDTGTSAILQSAVVSVTTTNHCSTNADTSTRQSNYPPYVASPTPTTAPPPPTAAPPTPAPATTAPTQLPPRLLGNRCLLRRIRFQVRLINRPASISTSVKRSIWLLELVDLSFLGGEYRQQFQELLSILGWGEGLSCSDVPAS